MNNSHFEINEISLDNLALVVGGADGDGDGKGGSHGFNGLARAEKAIVSGIINTVAAIVKMV